MPKIKTTKQLIEEGLATDKEIDADVCRLYPPLNWYYRFWIYWWDDADHNNVEIINNIGG